MQRYKSDAEIINGLVPDSEVVRKQSALRISMAQGQLKGTFEPAGESQLGSGYTKFEYDGYECQAKVYVTGSDYGIDGGPISKLNIRKDGKEVYNYDRGDSDTDDLPPGVLDGIKQFLYSELKRWREQNPDEFTPLDPDDEEGYERWMSQASRRKMAGDEDEMDDSYRVEYGQEINKLRALLDDFDQYSRSVKDRMTRKMTDFDQGGDGQKVDRQSISEFRDYMTTFKSLVTELQRAAGKIRS